MRAANRNIFAIPAVLIALCLMAPAASALEKDKITVAMIDNTPNTIDHAIYYALSELEIDVNINSYGPTSAIAVVSDNEADLLSFQTMSVLDSNPNLVVVPEPLGIREYRVYVRKGDDADILSWEDFAGKNIAYPLVGPYIQSRVPWNVRSVSNFSSAAELFGGLFNKDYDYVILSASLGQPSINIPDGVECIASLDRQEAFSFVNKKSAWLAPVLARKYREMKESGIMQAIYDRNFNQGDKHTNEILCITSHADAEWERELRNGFTSEMSFDTNSVNYYSLNSRIFQNNIQRERHMMDIIRSDFVAQMPDVIVVFGNDAFKLLKEHYNLIFMGIPVVLCDLVGFSPEDAKGFEKYFTGVTSEISAWDTAQLALELFTSANEFYIINDYSEAGLAWKNEFSKQLEGYNITFSPDVPISELIVELGNLPENTIVFYGNYYFDSTNRYISQTESQSLFGSVIKVPSFGFLDINIKYNQLGGKCIRAFNQGVLAQQLVDSILSGSSVSELPLMADNKYDGSWYFNKLALDKWSIKLSQLPKENITVINRQLPIWEANRNEFILLIALIFIVLIALLVLTLMLRAISHKNNLLTEAQKSLHTTEEMLEKEKAIEDVKRRLERIISSAPIGFTITRNGILLDSNSYVKEFFDIKEGEKVDRLFVDINEYIKANTTIRSGGSLQHFIATLVTSSGEHCRYVINGTKIDFGGEPAYVQWIVNIEETERARDEIKCAHEDIERIIHALPMPVMLLDTARVSIEMVNEKFIEMFGFRDMAQAKETSYYDLFPAKQGNRLTSEIIAHNLKTVDTSGAVQKWERTYKLLNGDTREAEVIGSRLMYKERDTFVIILRDISAEREHSRMLHRIAEREKEDNKLKSSFLVNMSHEIRTPMNAIIGLSELALRKGGSPETLMETMEKISKSSKILLTIINDILDFSKIESGRLDFVEEEFLLEEVLSNATLVASQRLGDKPVEMLINISPEVPLTLIGDKTRMWQIIKNFLDNSAKFTETGRIVCEVSVFETGPKKVSLEFNITDTGIGISYNNIDRIFRPFEQIANSSQYIHAGTGLGMSISKQLITLMGGGITLKSREGKGTHIQCIIPFSLPKKPLLLRENAPKDILAGKSILIADDDIVAREVMASLLEFAQVKLTCVSNGEEAIKLVNSGEQYDIIILDYQMTGLDGIATAEEITRTQGRGTKLLMVSAFSKQLFGKEIEEAGFFDVIEKPFSPTAFYTKLSAALGLISESKEIEKALSFPNARVLLCEDNYVNQEVALEMLREFGIKADVAENGQQALDLLETQTFDLVLMDIIMPVLDGHETTKLIRGSQKPYQHVPIVAMTANAMTDEIQKCHAEGMNGHIAKPVEFSELQKALLTVLGNKQ